MNFLAKKFDPKSCRKTQAFKGKPLKRKIKKVHLTNGRQQIYFASIPKENLSFERFQRPHESQRSEKIAENFHKDFGVVNVSEIEHNGLYYYTITDGQHRSFANPEDSVPCIITNGLAPAHAFLLGNSNTKAVSKDDILWANYHANEPEARWFFKTLRRYDLMPHRLSGDVGKKNIKDGKFVGSAKLFQVYQKIQVGVGQQLPILPSDEQENVSRQRFNQVLEIMTGIWGADAFCSNPSSPTEKAPSKSAYRDVWMAMLLLMDEKKWPTSSDTIIKSISKGYFSKNGRGQIHSETYKDLKDLRVLAKKHWPDVVSGSSEKHRQQALRNVLNSMLICGQK